MTLWYMDDEFDTQLPEALADEIARFYGTGQIGIDFAQMLAAFIAVPECRTILRNALSDGDDRG
jgi:hypothetical protein